MPITVAPQWAIMTASHLDGAFERWRSALLDSLATPGNVMAWQDRRYQFAYQVRQLLVDSGPGIPPVSDHVVYGVYVTGGGLLYVGQTRDARPRTVLSTTRLAAMSAQGRQARDDWTTCRIGTGESAR